MPLASARFLVKYRLVAITVVINIMQNPIPATKKMYVQEMLPHDHEKLMKYSYRKQRTQTGIR